MHIETERKFLVKDESYKAQATESHRITQGYICRESGRTVRVRLRDDKAFLTIKGGSDASGMSRFEWEKEIPAEDARDLFMLCQGGIIDKTRYIVPARSATKAARPDNTGSDSQVGQRFFEVDEFHGENDGLVMAEIELGSETESFEKPDWLGAEVTGDRRYYNSMLSARPFSEWG